MPRTDVAEPDTDPAATPAAEASPAPADAPTAPAEGLEPAGPETPAVSEVPAAGAEPGTEAPPPTTEAEPDLSAYEPFQFRADGQDWTYTGAVRDDEGNVLFTPAAAAQLQRDLAYARAYPRRDAEAQRALTQERTARQAAEATVQTVLGKFEELFEQSQTAGTFEELAETPLGQWVLQRHAEWPNLRAQALQRGFDLRSRAMEEELQRYRGQEMAAQLQPLMLGRVEDAVRHWGPEAGLDRGAEDELIRRLSTEEALAAIFPVATADNPVTGTRAGQRYENVDVIRQEMLFLRNLLNRGGGARAEDVAAENARRQGQGGQQPPPGPGGARATPPPKATKTKYRTTHEADEDIWR